MFGHDSQSDMTFINIFAFAGIFVGLFYILSIGASFIIPFIVALLFSFAIIGLSNFFKSFKIPPFFSFCLSVVSYVFCFWLVGKLIGSSINDLVNLLPSYQLKVSAIISDIFSVLHIKEPASVSVLLQKIDLQYLFTSFVGAIASIFSNAGVIFFYVLFILFEYRFFKTKLNLMIVDGGKKKKAFEIIEKVKHDIRSYFFIKTVMSICSGVMSFVIMKLFHLDFALFLAFVIFLFNFIPNVGSIIAMSFAFALSLIQFDAYSSSFFMFALLVGIDMVMGNIVEPQFMGNRLNLSPLVIIISLVFWGTIWGIVGMLLAVPIMVIINIILAKIPSTRSIAILLSEKGEIEIDSDEKVEQNRKRFFKTLADKFRK